MIRFILIESIQMSVKNIISNKVRSFLTVLGVLIGVASVVIMVSIGQGASKSIRERIEGMGANLLILNSGRTFSYGVVKTKNVPGGASITERDLEFLKSLRPEYIADFAPQASASMQAKRGNENINTCVIGTTEPYQRIRNVELSFGRFINSRDLEDENKNVVIGFEIYKELFGEGSNPLGQTVKLKGLKFRVIGVVKETGGGDDEQSFIPYTVFSKYASRSANYQTVQIQVDEYELMEDLQAYLEERLMQMHGISDETKADFYFVNMKEIMDNMSEVSNTLSLLLGGIAGISLVVGGIGIMNIMLVSVTERTKEIGIRMALGAKVYMIMFQFVIESIFLSFIGGLLGVSAGIGGSLLAGRLGMDIAISYPAVAGSLLISSLIGLFFGTYPAYRASMLNPIEALRYE